jgi:hypothetical protein
MPQLSRTPVTTPAPKYGPTNLYGGCEAPDCNGTARITCAECDGHFCRRHEDHEAGHEPKTSDT